LEKAGVLMSEQRDFLRRLIDVLEKAGVPYMIAGSLASSFHGRPRATNDIDLVIVPTESQLRRFLNILGPDYYVSEDAVWAAWNARSAFNVIDVKTGWKADLRIRQARPFSVAEFERRQKANILSTEVWVLSPEDAILSKLEWAKESGSAQQAQDVLGILQMQSEKLDKSYLWEWAEILGVRGSLEELWEKVRKELK
jgi:hypothetical protein